MEGGLFDTTSDAALEMAFRYSMKIVQANRQILPRSRLSRVPLGSGNVEFLPPNDSFIASKKGEIKAQVVQKIEHRSNSHGSIKLDSLPNDSVWSGCNYRPTIGSVC